MDVVDVIAVALDQRSPGLLQAQYLLGGIVQLSLPGEAGETRSRRQTDLPFA